MQSSNPNGITFPLEYLKTDNLKPFIRGLFCYNSFTLYPLKKTYILGSFFLKWVHRPFVNYFLFFGRLDGFMIDTLSFTKPIEKPC